MRPSKDSRTSYQPAPVGGLNVRDSIAAMDPKDAVIFSNWWPSTSDVMGRKGFQDWATGLPSAVESLFDYNPSSGAYELFAASGSAFYDVTNTGAVGAAVVSGLSNAKWQHTNMVTPGGSFLYCFNGVDSPQLYNGATWQAVTGASAPIAITGVTTSNLVLPCVFKNRLFMVEKNTLKAWYLPVQSIGGAANSIDLSSVFQRGGYLMFMATWTLDAGMGMDDHAVFMTSEGEVAVYRGTDPSSSATWALVGVFYLGRPVGRKCYSKFGGDLLVLCETGLFPLAKGLLSSAINRQAARTDKVQLLVSQEISSYFNEYGWTVTVYPDQNMLILNIPKSSGHYQLAQNTITDAWTIFDGMDADSWVVLGNELFFGGDGVVCKAWNGYLDNTSAIIADGLQAFSYFGSTTQDKLFTMVRPTVMTSGTPSILYTLNTNFDPQPATGTLTYTPPTGMVWGSMVWGSMVWGGSLETFSAWQTVGDMGYSGALRLTCQTNGSEVHWVASDYLYRLGGVL